MIFSKKDILEQLNSKNKKMVLDALLYMVFNVDDFNWVQNECLTMLDNNDEDICGLAITCIGHIARIYSKIDKDKVISKLTEKAKDVRFTGRVQDAFDDIEMFVK